MSYLLSYASYLISKFASFPHSKALPQSFPHDHNHQSDEAHSSAGTSPDFGFYPGYNDLPQTLDPSTLHPVIRDFLLFIENKQEISHGIRDMFEQIPSTTKYEMDVAGIGPQIRNYIHMLDRLNKTLTWAPAFGDRTSDFVPFPISTLFNWPMCTNAGYQIFTNPDFNRHIRCILNTWAHFLSSPQSRYTLTDAPGGWLSPRALEVTGGPDGFENTFVCDPKEEYYGFNSWDEFFTRGFKEGIRPVDSPHDNSVIVNACESTFLRVARNVKEEDKFWIKGEPYSLRHMLNGDPLTVHFIGGTVYQSYLSQLDYHRWHSPVDGTILKIVSVPGTYFAISTGHTFHEAGESVPNLDGYSEPFMSSVATRTLIFIQADNPDIGLMVFEAIGMEEVSSCEATVKKGERVRKGDELGMFHFGGSSYVLIFRPETDVVFEHAVVGSAATTEGSVVLLNRRIGTVRHSSS